MGDVVKLEPAERKSAQPRWRRKRSKTALVLGGGGFTGGVYEIGALRALDLLTVNRTVNDFDVFVGTSTGSFVAAPPAHRGRTPGRAGPAGGRPDGQRLRRLRRHEHRVVRRRADGQRRQPRGDDARRRPPAA